MILTIKLSTRSEIARLKHEMQMNLWCCCADFNSKCTKYVWQPDVHVCVCRIIFFIQTTIPLHCSYATHSFCPGPHNVVIGYSDVKINNLARTGTPGTPPGMPTAYLDTPQALLTDSQ